MEVLINSHLVEFELEIDSTIPEIVESISNWARERGLLFHEVFLNDVLYSLDSIEESEHSDVDIINCVIDSKSNIVFSTLDEGALYCNRVIEYIGIWMNENSVDMDEISNLTSGIEWLIEVLNKVILLLEIDSDTFKYKDRDISGFIEELQKVENEVKEDDEKEILNRLENYITLFKELKDIFRILLMSEEMKSLILKSIDSPDRLMESLQNISEDVEEIVKNIEETAIAFQIGKDELGVEKLNKFIDFMLRYTRACYQVAPVFNIDLSTIVVNEVTLEDKNSHFMELLNYIVESMENNDIISLSDVLEYEIIPSIENLDQYIDQLMSNINLK